jgi:hypothetical protein
MKLHFGPYQSPRCRVGGYLDDALRGRAKIVGVSDSPVAWPISYSGRKRALIVCGDLLWAIRMESVQAVAHHWGVSNEWVRRKRRALGVPEHDPGTRWLFRRLVERPAFKRDLRRWRLRRSTPSPRPRRPSLECNTRERGPVCAVGRNE